MKTYQSVFNKLENLGAWYGDIGKVCEPGYDNVKPYLFGNWNNISRELENALSEHFELEWDDEWISCENCGRYFRSNPDSYSWTLYGEFYDGGCLCGDCIKENPTETIDRAINNPEICLRDFLDPSDYGFENLNGTFENGLHEHMNDDPNKILPVYRAKYPDYEFVFANLGASQFYVDFEIWGRPKTDRSEDND